MPFIDANINEQSEGTSKICQEAPKTPPRQMIPEPISAPEAPQRFRRPRSNAFSEYNDEEGSYLKRPFIKIEFVPDSEDK
jgi:hypothetical protein